MALVVPDASVAIKWVLDEAPMEDTEQARGLLKLHSFAVPGLFHFEIANIMWVKARRREIDGPAAKKAIRALRLLPLAPVGAELWTTAFDLGRARDHSPYDCAYVAAALVAGADAVVTADRRFARAFAAWEPPGRRPLPVLALGDARLSALS